MISSKVHVCHGTLHLNLIIIWLIPFPTAFARKDGIPEEFKRVFETANKYHFLHSIALMGAPLCRRPLLVR